MKALLIVGTGRSGSTLLANALGSVPGVVSLGEVKLVFERGLIEADPCACGRTADQCRVWLSALRDSFGEVPTTDTARHYHRQLTDLTRTRQLSRLLVNKTKRRLLGRPEWKQWSGHVADILTSAAEAANAHAVVDSSRLPAYAALVESSGRLDVSIIHLVRNPQAVAWSWQRGVASQALEGFDQQMERFSSFKTSCMWLIANSAIPLIWRGHSRLVVRYEDFVSDPEREMNRISQFTGVDNFPSVVTKDGLRLAESHAVAGNPNRGRTGGIRLSADDQWRANMPLFDRLIVKLLTWPRRRAYGY